MQFDHAQTEIAEDAVRLWQDHEHLRETLKGYDGGMTFKPVNGAEYLIRYWNDHDTGRKRTRSLGRRDERNEHVHNSFVREKRELVAKFGDVQKQLERTCRLAKAYRMQRVPADVGAFIRAVAERPMIASEIAFADADAVCAYETRIGAYCEAPPRRRAEPTVIRLLVSGPEVLSLATPLSQALGFDLDEASVHEERWSVAVEMPDGRLLELVDREGFDTGDLGDVFSIAFTKDTHLAPVAAVHPRLWLDVERAYPTQGGDADLRQDFVLQHADQVVPPTNGKSEFAATATLGP